MTAIEYPDAEVCPPPAEARSAPPPTVREPGDFQRWPLTLEEAVRMALTRGRVLRDLGGQVVQAPLATRTQWDPALQELNPQTGVDAALSAFDAQLGMTVFLDKDDRAFNNIFFSGGAAGALQSDTGTLQGQISKITPNGTRLSLQNINDYAGNNSPANLFRSAWETTWQGEVRQPLLRGAGLDVNRIAGPNAAPGQYQGVLIARLNTDTAITDFEIGVRDLSREVELAYWELYFAYRDLDAKTQGLDFALRTWKLIQDRIDVGTSDTERETLARSQYYQTKAQVEEAFAGRPGSPGGLLNAERRLRFLLGLPAADGRLILPVDEPTKVDVRFDFHEISDEALARRAELRQQQWRIRGRELQVVAARNLAMPQLDFIGQYRWRGLGDDLFGDTNTPNGSAIEDLLTGDLQGWRVGFELVNPVGNRQGNLAIRHAQLQLARDRAVLEAQQQRVVHEVAEAYSELDRAFMLTKSRFNESVASFEQAKAIYEKYALGPDDPTVVLENVLDAQVRAVQATSNYYRSLVDYNLALLQVHFAKGTLLDHHAIAMAEGPWSQAARDRSAWNTEHVAPTDADKVVHQRPLTRGLHPQQTLPNQAMTLGPVMSDPARAGDASLPNDSETDPGDDGTEPDVSAPQPDAAPEPPSGDEAEEGSPFRQASGLRSWLPALRPAAARGRRSLDIVDRSPID